ncbi:SGNH/GDSL hydrolase family protein [Candidatus Halobonum tyrrellensis]|uniref:SGNH hydrolase-type esterase domain-containing protein n=1 Tax=Candidatus Halobonum tyrrellensis G22 TaxID=1324957 RepID=V4GNP9_9EURY|nr:SGNH/GDSL hydrolase family protein [Candidatus Halobonum tyrrellensis]ESP87016.1 hypothetical protein K933_15892 [Candidatus Halobonum tyrrellensis G22]
MDDTDTAGPVRRDGIEFHNAAELRAVDGHEGRRLQRVPESVRTDLNEGGQDRMCHPAGVELRFVPDGPVELSLSTRACNGAESGTARVFWGPIESYRTFEVGPDPEPVTLEFPEQLGDLRPEETEGLAFDPRVCRVRLPGEHRGGHVYYHGVSGDLRPPRAEELPDRTYLAYGTSITEGEAATAEHLTYVSQTARRLDADLVNLGSCGTAYCDEAMADHVAARDDWDVATLAVSVNMVGTFDVETFRERAAYLVETVADAHPDDPVVPITIYRSSDDVRAEGGDPDRCERYRRALREVVAEADRDNVHLLEGQEVLPDIAGLTTDLVHPGDDAMTRMAENVAAELDPLVD